MTKKMVYERLPFTKVRMPPKWMGVDKTGFKLRSEVLSVSKFVKLTQKELRDAKNRAKSNLAVKKGAYWISITNNIVTHIIPVGEMKRIVKAQEGRK